MQKLFSLLLLFFILASSINAQPSEGLVAYYPFNGDASDASGNGHNGVNNGATISVDRFNNPNSAYFFNGSSNYINLGGWHPNQNDFSISLWINVSSQSNNTIISDGTSNVGFDLRLTDVLRFEIQNYNSYLVSYPFNTSNHNTWYHIVGTLSSGFLSLYFNGNLVSTISGVVPAIGTGNMNVGYDKTVNSHFFHGDIDDIRIYNRALNESEIQELYHENGWPLNQGLVAHYPLGNDLYDYSGNSNHGVFSGSDPEKVPDRFGYTDSARTFNNNFVRIQNSPSLDNFSELTVSAWVKNLGSINDNQTIVGKWNSTTSVQSWTLDLSYLSMKPQIAVRRSNNNIITLISNKNIPLNEWTHIVGRYDGLNLSLYVDGELDTSIAFTTQYGLYATNTTTAIGAHDNSGDRNPFNGAIDDIRIYNRALLETEISELYHENGWTGRELNTIIITHGFTAEALNPIENTRWEHLRWQFAMADAVSSNRDIYLIRKGEVIAIAADYQDFQNIDSLTSIENVINSYRVSRAIDPNKDNVFIFDWTLESAVNSDGFAEAAADVLAATLINLAKDNSFLLKNLHFIGHSRGCVVNSEAIERLIYWANNGMVPESMIDKNIHMTTLDPHPAGHWYTWVAMKDDAVNSNNIGIGICGWKSGIHKTAFIDNYWENASLSLTEGLSNYPGLDSSNSISNNDLTPLLPNGLTLPHQLVHTWYYGTVDNVGLNDEFNHGPAIDRQNWYSSTLGTTQGFYFSRSRQGPLSEIESILSGQGGLIDVNSDFKLISSGQIFNGDFTKYSSSQNPLGGYFYYFPGWSFQDGISSQLGGFFNPAAKLTDSNPILTHNSFFIPSTATECVFRMRVDYPLILRTVQDELQIYFDELLIKSIPIYSIQWNYGWGYFGIPDGFKGKTCQMTFKLNKNQTGESVVNIDDIGMRYMKKISSTVACPVDFHIYDNLGNHTGPINDSTFVEEIPGSEYYVYEDSTGDKIKTVYLEPLEGNANYIFRIQSRDTSSSFSYEIEDYSDTTRGTISYLFEEVAIEPNTVATCTLNVSTQVPSLEVDLNGDEIVDSIYVPEIITEVEIEENSAFQLPTQYLLNQNYPNPFNPLTNITYSLPERSLVKVKVFDILGKEIATLVNEEKERGNYSVQFNSSGLASGIYFYQLKAGDFISTKKMILLK